MFLKGDGEDDFLSKEQIDALCKEQGFDRAFELLLKFVEEVEEAQANHYDFEQESNDF